MEWAVAASLLALLGSAWAWLRRRRARARFELRSDQGSFYASLRARPRTSLEEEPEAEDTGRYRRPPRQ